MATEGDRDAECRVADQMGGKSQVGFEVVVVVGLLNL